MDSFSKKSATPALVQLINFPQDRQLASPNAEHAILSATLALQGDVLHPVAANQGKSRAAAGCRVGFSTGWALLILSRRFVVGSVSRTGGCVSQLCLSPFRTCEPVCVAVRLLACGGPLPFSNSATAISIRSISDAGSHSPACSDQKWRASPIESAPSALLHPHFSWIRASDTSLGLLARNNFRMCRDSGAIRRRNQEQDTFRPTAFPCGLGAESE
jgi:hypothetical protein